MFSPNAKGLMLKRARKSSFIDLSMLGKPPPPCRVGVEETAQICWVVCRAGVEEIVQICQCLPIPLLEGPLGR